MAKNNTKPDLPDHAMPLILSMAESISNIPAAEMRTGVRAPIAVTMVRRAIIVAMIDAGIGKDDIVEKMNTSPFRFAAVKSAWAESKPTPQQRKIYDRTRQIIADAMAGKKPRPAIFASGSIPLPVKPRCLSGADIQAMHAEQERRRAMIRKMEYG